MIEFGIRIFHGATTMEAKASSLGGRKNDLLGIGVPGLDDVLGGGLEPNRLYLVEGTPGAGKTTIALQFLLEGAQQGESVLYVTLSETESELRGVANSHGWDLSGIHVREMLPAQDSLQPEEQYTMFHPSEVELSETTLRILSDVDTLKPSRIVFDSLSELRLLSGTSLRYRRQILALKQFFAGRQCTVLLLDDMTATEHDLQVQSIAHAVLRLEQLNSDYGSARRRLLVVKYRGQALSRGLSRLQDPSRGPAGVSAAGGLRTRGQRTADQDAQRHRGTGRPARGRPREGNEHPLRGRAGHGQIVGGRAVRRCRRRAGRMRRAFHLRREHQHAAHALRGPGDGPGAVPRVGTPAHQAGRPGRALAGRAGARDPPGRDGARRNGRSSSTA
jgi:KaiC/GvpD/RAD55 family RecA-like ATPase